MKKRILSATCALAIIANLVPLPAYAAIEVPEGAGYTLCFDVVDASGDGWVDAGEQVDVTVSIADAGWATNDSSMPLTILRVGFKFNNDLLELTCDHAINPSTPYAATLGDLLSQTNAVGYAFSDNAGDTEKGGLDYANETGEAIVLCEHALGQYVDLPDEKTSVFTYHFVAKDGVEGQPTFDIISESTSLSVGFVTGNPEDAKTLGSAPELEYGSIPQVDTKAPTIEVEGSVPTEGTTYYYQPLTVSATDEGSGLASLTLDGNAVTGNTVSAGGTLTATDERGNTATCTLTVDAAAFNAAKEAAAALPETITYADKDAVAAADAALKAVTDPTAASKLTAEAEKINAAAATISAIQEEISAVEAKIEALPTTGLTVKDAPALSEVETALAALEAKGVQTTDISNYATYTAAVEQLQAVMDEINAVKDLITALPSAEEVGYGDEAAVQKAEDALQALYAKYADDKEYIADAVGAATLDGIRASLDTLLETQRALVEKIANTQYNITMFEADKAVITGLRAEVDAMIARDATFTAAELKPLTDAETALAALTVQSEAAHAAVAALPEAADVLYTQKADIQAVADQMAALNGKDTFTAEETARMESAQQAIAAIETDIAAVTDKINALPATEQLSVKDAQALADIEAALTALEAKGVVNEDISNYTVYTAATEQLQAVMEEIDAVKEMIAALPGADEVSFGDEEAVKEAEAALDKLLAAHPDDTESLRDLVNATTLEEVRTSLNTLLQNKADLINTIKTTQFTISLSQADIAVIAGLRADVDKMVAQGASFGEEDLANLVRAEEDLADLKTESEAVHAAVAALPEADTVLYTDKAQIAAVAKQVEAMLAAQDTFTEEEVAKLESAQQAIQAIETEIQDTDAVLAELTGITEENATVENITAVQAARKRLQALFDKGVVAGDMANYALYQSAYAAVESWLNLVDDAEQLANALPEADAVVFGDEDAIQAAAQAYARLQAQGLDALVDSAAVQKMEAADNALTALKQARVDLVAKIADSKLNITLNQADRDAITALRADVTAMEAKGTTFTSEELANLTAAESNMTALVARSQAAHAALAALPARDKVLYTENDKLTEVEQEMEALRKLGDTFTAEEAGKLADAQAGIADLEAAVEALALDMTELKDPTDEETPIQYADKANLETMEADITALEARACDVDSMIAALAAEDETYVGALARYAGYRTAVKAMVSELDALNADMSKAVAAWTYNDVTAYNAIMERMNAAAAKYAIYADLYAEVFPEYAVIPAKNEEVKAVLDNVHQKVDALPAVEDMTLDDAAKVQEITALLAKLKAEYGFTDAMLTQNLGGSYTAYQSSADKIAELQAAQKPTEEQPSQNDTQNNPQEQDTQSQQTETAAAPTATPAPVAAPIPQTGDPMNMPLTVALLALALGGLAVCVTIRRKTNR